MPDERDLRKVCADAQAALSYLGTGGKWKRWGLITPKPLRGRLYLRNDVLVNGIGASDIERLQVVCDHLDGDFALEKLRSVWENVSAALPPGDRELSVATLKERLSALQQGLEYADACRSLGQAMTAENPPIPEPDWLEDEAKLWVKLIDAANVEDRHLEAIGFVDSATEPLKSLLDLHDAHPVIQVLMNAIKMRDATAYSEGYDRVVEIETTRSDQRYRISIEKALVEAVPGLVEAVDSSLDSAVWDDPFGVWEEAWHWAIAAAWLEKRSDHGYQQEVERKWHECGEHIRGLLTEAAALRAWRHFFDRLSVREANALRGWREAVRALGKGTGRSAKAATLRQAARNYLDECRDAIPIWIMPRYLVADMFDPAPGRYDLVIVDEASQLGIESLFLFYVAKKILVVGDDQQISPYGVGIPDQAIANLQQHFLTGIPHSHALSAQSSVYANAKIRFGSNIVLREHFRCMPEIIQFSNDLCYASNGTPLDPLRAYRGDRLKPLVLRHLPKGYRKGSSQHATNPPEAEAIVAQIAACIGDPRYVGCTMGVISLQGEEQARLIERTLLQKLNLEEIEARRLICGDAYAFQGDERNIIFLSMVAALGETRIVPLSNDAARHRFNVAVSRAQDQLWLFHTAGLDALKPSCMRYNLLKYMLEPARQSSNEENQRFESGLERDVFREITQKGFHVRTQVVVGDPTNYRIDLVVEGMKGRLAVECDGDEWHGLDRFEHDMARQRDLERAGWEFMRIRGGDFYCDKSQALDPLWTVLESRGIKPGGIDEAGAELPTPLATEPTEMRVVDPLGIDTPEPVDAAPENTVSSNPELPFEKDLTELDPIASSVDPSVPYVTFEGSAGPDPRSTSPGRVAEGLYQIIQREGPVLAKRAYDIYLHGCGISRMGGELKCALNKSLQHAIRKEVVIKEDEFGTGGLVDSIVRLPNMPRVVVRERGPRSFEEIPPSELQFVARRVLQDKKGEIEPGSDAHLRAVLDFFDLQRLTTQVGVRLLDILDRHYPYVDEMVDGIELKLSDAVIIDSNETTGE